MYALQYIYGIPAAEVCISASTPIILTLAVACLSSFEMISSSQVTGCSGILGTYACCKSEKFRKLSQ